MIGWERGGGRDSKVPFAEIGFRSRGKEDEDRGDIGQTREWWDC